MSKSPCEREKMKITELQLRKIIKAEILSSLQEQSDVVATGKSGAADAEGTLDVKKIAETLKVDEAKLKTAVSNIRKGTRNAVDNGIFGDVFAALLKAKPEDTVKVMNILKKVSAD